MKKVISLVLSTFIALHLSLPMTASVTQHKRRVYPADITRELPQNTFAKEYFFFTERAMDILKRLPQSPQTFKVGRRQESYDLNNVRVFNFRTHSRSRIRAVDERQSYTKEQLNNAFSAVMRAAPRNGGYRAIDFSSLKEIWEKGEIVDIKNSPEGLTLQKLTIEAYFDIQKSYMPAIAALLPSIVVGFFILNGIREQKAIKAKMQYKETSSVVAS